MPNPLRSGVHDRGYLLHVKREGASYFVTFRLVDSLPRTVLLQFLEEKAHRLRALKAPKGETTPRCALSLPSHSAEAIERDYRRNIERYLDKGYGTCLLRLPAIAKMIKEAFRHFHNQQYLLDDWVIMPNHAHLILWPMPNFTLSEILKSRKQYTATQANLILGRTGNSFWQKESFDHWIRDAAEKSRIRHYIRTNPVKTGLCSSPEDWPWGSAWNGDESGLTPSS